MFSSTQPQLHDILDILLTNCDILLMNKYPTLQEQWDSEIESFCISNQSFCGD